MRIMMTICYLILIILGVSFAALNAVTAPVNFYLTTYTLPISVIIACSFGIGVLCGFLLFMNRYWRLKSTHKRVKNQLFLTEKEIKNLRAIPLHDQH